MASPLSSLSVRQQKYVQARMQGMNKYRAGLAAGYSEHMARAATAKIERGPVREAMSKLIRQHVPAHKLAKRLAEGLDAMETKLVTYEGAVTDKVDMIDYRTRLEYAKTIAEIGYNVNENDRSAQAMAAAGVNVTIKFIGGMPDISAEIAAADEARHKLSTKVG